jgi:squalene-hopene/tetraprenyl-beta-curcumene cyclase
MNTRLLVCLAAFATPLVAAEVSPATPAAPDVAREIAQRSLPFIQTKGVAWIEKRKCTSCHQVPSMLWSLNSAARAGLDLDRKDLSERIAWAVDWHHWPQNSSTTIEQVHKGNADTMVFLLLGRDRSADKDADWVREYQAYVLKNQQPDGSWSPQGQLPLSKRPARETVEVSTMWTLLALESYGSSAGIDPAVRKRADDFLATAQAGKSTEWYVLKVLLQPDNESLRTDLLKQQHSDGGWGWLTADPSDTFATGQALYALARTGFEPSAEPIQRAITFLKTTQQPDGSWEVPSTRASDKNDVIPTSRFWGTAWAVIGLLEPPARSARVTAK